MGSLFKVSGVGEVYGLKENILAAVLFGFNFIFNLDDQLSIWFRYSCMWFLILIREWLEEKISVSSANCAVFTVSSMGMSAT